MRQIASLPYQVASSSGGLPIFSMIRVWAGAKMEREIARGLFVQCPLALRDSRISVPLLVSIFSVSPVLYILCFPTLVDSGILCFATLVDTGYRAKRGRSMDTISVTSSLAETDEDNGSARPYKVEFSGGDELGLKRSHRFATCLEGRFFSAL